MKHRALTGRVEIFRADAVRWTPAMMKERLSHRAAACRYKADACGLSAEYEL